MNTQTKTLRIHFFVKYDLGESIPIRLFLAGYDMTPTMKDVQRKFSVRYYLNLVLIDEEERRYFKQQVSLNMIHFYIKFFSFFSRKLLFGENKIKIKIKQNNRLNNMLILNQLINLKIMEQMESMDRYHRKIIAIHPVIDNA